jgi:3',5'-cyclic AMP phosphodiesterase CpdA
MGIPSKPERIETPTSRSGAKILHISDIHVGRHFDPDKWDELVHLAAVERPDLIVVTGDLVESPWRSQLKKAKAKLDQLRDGVIASTNNNNLKLICVPGNHDTRFTGLFPIRWMYPFAATSLLAAVIGILTIGFRSGFATNASRISNGDLSAADWVVLALVIFSICSFLFRVLFTANLKKALGEYYLAQPALFVNELIGILPFDSASHGISSARGRVSRREMVFARKWVDQQTSRLCSTHRVPFFIALVHHHPLPLPYDHDWERMMVMDNAGEFLRQIGHSKVRLVLHGHKHHQHFARLAIDPATSERLEVAVLSAGTPSQGKKALPHRHGFNVIQITEDHHVTITAHESQGGPTFSQTTTFNMVPSEEHRRVRFEEAKLLAHASCRRMVCVVDLNRYGDGFFSREYRGVVTKNQALRTLPTPLVAHSESGIVAAYEAASLSQSGPGVMVKTTRVAPKELHATVHFKSSGLMVDHQPIDFELSFLNNNAFALNKWQFTQMYPQRDDLMEDVQFVLNADVAVEELVIHVQFPVELRLPPRVDARCRAAGKEEDNPWVHLKDAEVLRIASQNVLQLQLHHPMPNAVYQLNWDVASLGDAREVFDDFGPKQAISLRHALANFIHQPVPTDIQEIIRFALEEFQELMQAEEGVPLNASLFAYDEHDHCLKCISHTEEGPILAKGASYAFGLGIPGRAFKSSEILCFIKPADQTQVAGAGYLRSDGQVVETLGEISEEGIVCIPLTPSDAPGWPYAVLQVSWGEPSKALLRTALVETTQLETLEAAYSLTLTEHLTRILLHSTPERKDFLHE